MRRKMKMGKAGEDGCQSVLIGYSYMFLLRETHPTIHESGGSETWHNPLRLREDHEEQEIMWL